MKKNAELFYAIYNCVLFRCMKRKKRIQDTSFLKYIKYKEIYKGHYMMRIS